MNVAGSLLTALLVVGCSSAASVSPAPAATPESPTFHLANVKASFTNACVNATVADKLFCDQIHIGGMSSDGVTLNVPTTLNAAARERAAVICDLVARAHLNGVGRELGFKFVGVLDRDGGQAATCSVS